LHGSNSYFMMSMSSLQAMDLLRRRNFGMSPEVESHTKNIRVPAMESNVGRALAVPRSTTTKKQNGKATGYILSILRRILKINPGVSMLTRLLPRKGTPYIDTYMCVYQSSCHPLSAFSPFRRFISSRKTDKI
jgi:hypothetical protein